MRLFTVHDAPPEYRCSGNVLESDLPLEICNAAFTNLSSFRGGSMPDPVRKAFLDATEHVFPQIRERAIRELLRRRGAFGNEFGSILIQGLEDCEAGVRAAAAWGLGEVNVPTALDPLLALEKDPDVTVRGAVCHALMALSDVQAVDVVLRMLPVLEPGDQLQVLSLFPGRFPSDRWSDLSRFIVGLSRSGANAVGDWQERNRVAESALVALGKLGNEAALPFLLEQIRSVDVGHRRAAVKAIGYLGSPAAFDPLKIWVSEDSDSYVRYLARWAMSRCQ